MLGEPPRLVQPVRANVIVESKYVPHPNIFRSYHFTRFQTLLQLSTASPGQVAPAPTSVDANKQARKTGELKAGLRVRDKSALGEVSCTSDPTLDARPGDTVALGHKGTQGNFRLNDRRSGEENSSGWQIGPTVDIRKDPLHQQRVSEEERRVGFSSDQEGEGPSAVQVSAATPVEPLSAMLTGNGRVSSVSQLLVCSCRSPMLREMVCASAEYVLFFGVVLYKYDVASNLCVGGALRHLLA